MKRLSGFISEFAKHLDLPEKHEYENDPCVRCERHTIPQIMNCPVFKERGECRYLLWLLDREREELASAGVPKRYLEILYKEIDETEAVQIARKHASEVRGGGCLVLSGPVGIGKTVAAVRLLRWLYRWGVFGIFVAARGAKVDPPCLKTPALLLDDMGQERYHEDIETILETRHAGMLATIITTNMSLSAVRRVYGERVVDRFREWAIFYELKGSSLRRHDGT